MARTLDQFSNNERLTWELACDNMPNLNESTKILGKCLGLKHSEIVNHYVAGTYPKDDKQREMLQKLAHPQYGRAFAAIRLTALGVADQYDWADK
jgi:hypothetical protein